jgi:1,4-dihydroxy-2-naphthoate octaprenyltransferase
MFENIWEFYRMEDWVKVLGIALLGLTTLNYFLLSPLSFFLCISECSLLLAFLFSFNNFEDFLKEGEKNFIGNLIDKRRLSKNLALFLCFLPLILSLIPLYINFSYVHFTLYALFAIFAFGYSAPRIRLRDVPFVDVFCNVVFYYILFFISYFYLNNSITLEAYFYLIWITFFFSTSEILHQIDHFEKDRKNKRTSTAIFLGKESTIWLFKSIFLASIVVGLAILVLYPTLRIYAVVLIGSGTLKFIYFGRKISKKTNLQKLRYNMGGMLEGIAYILLNILKL